MRFGADIKMAAILAAEVAGDRTPRPGFAQLVYHEVIDPAIAMHGGRIFELEPAHTLVEFTTPLDAVRCAQQITAGLARRSAGVPPEERLDLRIGIHWGEVSTEGGALEGPGLDIARRLEDLAEPAEICVSSTVRAQVEPRLEARFQDLAGIPGRYVPRGGLAFRLEHGAAGRAEVPGVAAGDGWLPAALRLGLVALLGAAALWLALAQNGSPAP